MSTVVSWERLNVEQLQKTEKTEVKDVFQLDADAIFIYSTPGRFIA